MMKTPELVGAIVEAARLGTQDAGRPEMSVSIKTRIGYNKEEIDTWIPAVLKTNVDALTVHLRTRKEMSKVPAHWDLLSRVVALRNDLAPRTFILGNGDVESIEEATRKVAETGADGVMLGRAIFGNPWLFTGISDVSAVERLNALVLLAEKFEQMKPAKSFHILKKHVKAFVTGFDGAAELRAELMQAESASEIKQIVEKHKTLQPE